MGEKGGIVDEGRNPFVKSYWIDQGHGLTVKYANRQASLGKLFGKSVEEIKKINPNLGSYPAFVGIRWGFAEINDNQLIETEKWVNRLTYDEFGHPLGDPLLT